MKVMAVRLKMIREKLDLTQQQVADMIGVSKTNYNYFENGERFIPLMHLLKFCESFDVSIDYIFELSDISITSKRINSLDKKEIGRRIREIRQMNNLTQKQLAEILNTSQSTVSAYESGKTLIITAFLFELCKRLDVSMDYIATKSNIMKLFNDK